MSRFTKDIRRCAEGPNVRALRAIYRAAAKAAGSTEDRKGLWDAYKAKMFLANELKFAMVVHEFGGWADDVADELERNLSTIVLTVAGGLGEARRAYRDKLLGKDLKQFADVRYEIAAASGAASFFDAGTMKLEDEIGGAKKNSDIKGRCAGKTIRMEVRVVHDDWPPRLDDTLEQVI